MSDSDGEYGNDYEDEDDDYTTKKQKGNKRKGKKLKNDGKKRVRQFFEMDAEESDNEQDEDQGKDLETRKKISKNEQNEGAQEEALYKTRKTRQLYEVVKDLENDEDIDKRYAEVIKEQEYYDDDDYYDDDQFIEGIPESLKKHKILVRSDQKMFSVPVRKLREKEVVICLLNKFAQLRSKEKTYQNIYSISYIPTVEQLVYIEARSKRDALYFLKDFPDINFGKVDLVNHEEFACLYQEKEGEIYNVEEGMFVKISTKCRNCDYINDLGQIFKVKAQNKVVVKLIPRINIEELKKGTSDDKKNYDFQEADGDEFQKHFSRKFSKFKGQQQFVIKTIPQIEATRPNQQFFSAAEYQDLFSESNAFRAISEYFEPEGDHCGYVYKTFNCKDLILNYQPNTLEELKKFFPHQEIDQVLTENQKFLKKSMNSVTFQIGDKVLVTGGQVKGLKGKIVSLTKDAAKILIRQKKNKNTFEEEVEVKYLSKIFPDGQRVKVISGASEGITGNVLSTDGDICSIFTDNCNTIEVRSRDLAVTGEKGIENESIQANESTQEKSAYKKKDLVRLTGLNQVGLVLDIMKDFVKILDSTGKIKNINNYSINSKIETRQLSSLNSEGSKITSNSNVLINRGQYQGHNCQVVHVYKHLVFLFDPKFRDSYVVENINNVSLMTANPVIARKQVRMAYDMKYGVQENIKPDDMRQYIGKSMKIIGGQYKGNQCTVIDFRNNQVKVEVHSKFISVFIPKADIIQQEKSDQSRDLDYGKTPSYIAQSTHVPNFSARDNYPSSPSYY